MRFPIVSLAIAMAVTHQAMALTYWIDSTCTGDKSVDETVEETKLMAKSAHTRLNSASDTDFQNIYEYAMKRTKDTNDPVFKGLSDFYKDVGDITPEADRNSANIRIYCDESEARWKERVDEVSGRKLGGWEDKDNWIFYRHDIRPGCLLTILGKGKVTYGETFKDYLEGDAPEKQAELRATISLCDKLFFQDGKPIKGKLLANIKPSADLTKLSTGIDQFQTHTSKILLHELSHTKPYDTKDHSFAYNWRPDPSYVKNILKLSADELATHADVRAILGQLALLADRGFTMHRKPREDASQKEKDDYNNDTENGLFRKYDNISKRSLQRRLARRARRYARASV